MLDDTLPLTPPEWPEWGNPIESEKDFRTILSYSPYDNLAAKDYPAILAMGGLTDPRVTYWEPAKWIARLRATMRAAARCCCAPTWAPATAARRGGSTGWMRWRSSMRSRCGRRDWRRRRRCERQTDARLGGGHVRSAISAILRNCSRVVPPAACTAMPCRIAER